MTTATAPASGATALDRLRSGICRRAFSSPEALTYEALVGQAVFSVAGPVVDGLGLAGRVLDVGCGGGRLAEHLAENGASVTVGVDPSMSQARRLARRGRHLRVGAVRASAGALPFPDKSFEAVVSCCALKHWPDPVLGLTECVRVTRPGGPIVLIEIAGEGTQEEMARFTKLTRIPPGLRDAYVRFAMRTVVSVAPSAKKVNELLREAGLDEAMVSRIEHLPFSVAVGHA